MTHVCEMKCGDCTWTIRVEVLQAPPGTMLREVIWEANDALSLHRAKEHAPPPNPSPVFTK